ncbi:hypothetical protein ACHAQA_004781 [Verticillium albo-atrum]
MARFIASRLGTYTRAAVLLVTVLQFPQLGLAVDAPECVSNIPGGPVQITADCLDPIYGSPVIDSKADQFAPVPHHRVNGHFNGTDIKFSVYLPPKDQWAGRFFQLVYPLQDHHATDEVIAFAIDTNGYAIHATGSLGYRADAAAAKFAKTVAREYYDVPSEHIYGYVYGGSGGSFQTVGAIENTLGVWDGAVPIVQAVPVSNPNSLGARALGALVLRPKARELADSVSPGGSGNPDSILDTTQRAVLREVTKLGIPRRGWENFEAIADTELLLQMVPSVKGIDPSYVDDYWSKPGYLGTEQSALGNIIRDALVDFRVTIAQIERDEQGVPTSVTLQGAPADLNTAGLEFNLFGDDEEQVGTLLGFLEESGNVVTLKSGNSDAVLDTLSEGTQLRIDNRLFIALHSIHRHLVPARGGFYGFDQFRDDDGKPIYPQRAVDISQIISTGTSGGGTHTGNITGKVIAVNNLLDADAFPWHADWYRSEVERSLGSRAADNYRIWYNDHADHFMGPLYDGKSWQLVEFSGIYEQALRDLSAWVEEDKTPPGTTGYTVVDSQVILANNATARRGVQPVVRLVRDGTGEVVSVAWDSRGTGDFVEKGFEANGSSFKVEGTFRYCKPGTYFPNVRVVSQREGDAKAPFGRIQTLGRARVIVQ